MNLSRKKVVAELLFAIVVCGLNILIGKEVFSFIGGYIVYGCVSLGAAIVIVNLLLILFTGNGIITEEERKQREEDAKRCPYKVE